MGNHRKSDLDKARDELMSHVVRCDVLDASMEHRMEWLADTMGFMSERYPQLSDLQMAQLEMIGKQFLRPPIPHGSGNTAMNPDTRTDEAPAEDIETTETVEMVETEASVEAAVEPAEATDENAPDPETAEATAEPAPEAAHVAA